jgi:hypothetical protein
MKEVFERARANEIKRNSLNVRLLFNLVVKYQTKRGASLPALRIFSLSFTPKHNYLVSKQVLWPRIFKTKLLIIANTCM